MSQTLEDLEDAITDALETNPVEDVLDVLYAMTAKERRQDGRRRARRQCKEQGLDTGAAMLRAWGLGA